ncbi:MAG TPA: adenylate/guanylate cyclase domain-containing protein [Actinomycetota bacterium]|nr:adenylate/guanylate cyclase domain-containing protein [Actinomycetota bacterium]
MAALFCDLVGSTELAERTDPEVLRRIFDRYFEAMRGSIERHGGTVEKFIGDAVVGTFGIPTAHEDDALRAVRAALEMRSAAADLDREIGGRDRRIRVRIAVDAGETFADDVAAVEGRIAGDVFNTAARLQSTAHAGDVLISAAAERLSRGHLRTEPVGPHRLKGKAEPVQVLRVLGVREAPPPPQTPFVGRSRAMTMLEQALGDALEGEACVLVTVLAPPGVGKSRLGEAFADVVRGRARVLVAQTPSYGEGVTFSPLIELLTTAADVPAADAEAVASALRGRLVAEPDGSAVADRLAQVLGVHEALAADASWAVRRLLEVLSADQPLVVILDDAHWAEEPMLDIVESVVDRFHGPLLVLCLARPELLDRRPTWAAGKPRTVTTTLPPLARSDTRRLAEALLADAPEPVIDRVCETAEGNPLFLEQLAAMLSDRGSLVDGRWRGASDGEVEIPSTVQALLAARVDALDAPARTILEHASVEGRRFRIAAVRALGDVPAETALDRGLLTLERRGLIDAEDEAAGRWRFAHALIAETAYRGISKELRAALHERLAAWLLSEDAGQPDVDESAARHLERAFHLREELGIRDESSRALAEQAGLLFADAGSRAFAGVDLIAARDLLGRAARLLPTESSRRLDLLPSLGVALTETGRPDETEALLVTAMDQARSAGSEGAALRARIQLLANRVYRSPTQPEIEAAAVEAHAAAEALEALGDGVGLAEAAIAIEYLGWMRGDLEEHRLWGMRAVRHGLAAGRPREAAQGVADAVLATAYGRVPFDGFLEVAKEFEAIAEHPLTAGASAALRAMAALGAGDDDTFERQERARREVLERHGLPWLAAAHGLVIAALETWTGRAEVAEQRLLEAREVLSAAGDVWWLGTIDSLLCRALAAQGRHREFLTHADAFEASDLVPDRDTLVRRPLVRARALLIRGSTADAEDAARRALAAVEGSDLILSYAEADLMLADVLEARGRGQDAAAAREHAVSLLEAKRFRGALEHLASSEVG